MQVAFLACLAVVLVLAPAAHAQGLGGCPNRWVYFQASCYQSVGGKRTFGEAELHCVTKESHLATVHSQQENEFLQGMIESGKAWIGMIASPAPVWTVGAPPIFTWVDGSDGMDYQNWAKNKPRLPVKKGIESHAVLKKTDGLWFDSKESNKLRYICKKPVAGLPAPTQCEYNGATAEIGDVWRDEAACTIMTCMENGVVLPALMDCEFKPEECPEGSMEYVNPEEECCGLCVPVPEPGCWYPLEEVTGGHQRSGAKPRTSIKDLSECKKVCEKDVACIAIDWSNAEAPYLYTRCWMYVSQPLTELRENPEVDHFAKGQFQICT